MKMILKGIGVLFLVVLLVVVATIISLESRFPTSTIAVKPVSQTPTISESSSILIFGATRNTGLMVARLLEARGDNVTAFVRPSSNTTDVEKLNVDMVVGDAMDIETVRAAFVGRDYTAVLTTIGCLFCEVSPDYQANANIFQAAKEAGVKRMLMVSSLGAGDSISAMPMLAKWMLKKILPLKTQAEDYLRSSGLDYTIIRPGQFLSGRQVNNAVLSEDSDVYGYIIHADLPDLIVSVLDDDSTIGKTLSAVDKEIRILDTFLQGWGAGGGGKN